MKRDITKETSFNSCFAKGLTTLMTLSREMERGIIDLELLPKCFI